MKKLQGYLSPAIEWITAVRRKYKLYFLCGKTA